MNRPVTLLTVLIALFAKTGFAIKCYHCDSSRNPECNNLEAGGGLVAETCTPSRIGRDGSSWLQELIKIDFFQSTSEVNVPMVCQKIVAVHGDSGEKITARTCQLDGGRTDPCTIAVGKAKLDTKVQIEHCSICDSDMCNGSVKQHQPPHQFFAGLIAMTTITLFVLPGFL